MARKLKSIANKTFINHMKKEYQFLYQNFDRVAGYSEALDYGDMWINNHPQEMKEFCKVYDDMITSDREVVAFAFTLEHFGMI